MHPTMLGLSLAALITVTCASVDTTSASRPRSDGFGQDEGTLSALLVLPAKKVRAGATLPGQVVVENGTGRALNVDGCGSPFAVVLTNDDVRPEVFWPSCLERITIPPGTSNWPVTVAATYSSCAGDGQNIVPCDDGEIPPLPVGRYQAVLFQNPQVVARPAPINIRVVKCGCTL